MKGKMLGSDRVGAGAQAAEEAAAGRRVTSGKMETSVTIEVSPPSEAG